MSLSSRVQAAGNVVVLEASRERTVDTLREQVQELMPAQQVAALAKTNPERARNELREACRQVFARPAWGDTSDRDKVQMIEELLAGVFGFGPIEPLLRDSTVTEIMVNGAHTVFYERGGVLYRSETSFSSDEQVRALIDRILGPLGRRIDESSPMVNARLPEGHRVHAVIPPLALEGPTLTIRKFSEGVISLDDMVRSGSIEPSVRDFLIKMVSERKNIAVSGGTGSGKTTMLNALSCHIGKRERIITIEDSAELKFGEHPHVVRLEARPRNAEGLGEVTIRDLVVNSLRMRPDRIIVGECRSSEALDMLQAMLTGHDGSLTTLHANSPRETVSRLVTMVRYAADLPVDVVEAQIAGAFDIVVQTQRDANGSRFVSEIAAVTEGEGAHPCRVAPVYVRASCASAGEWFTDAPWLDPELKRDTPVSSERAA